MEVEAQFKTDDSRHSSENLNDDNNGDLVSDNDIVVEGFDYLKSDAEEEESDKSQDDSEDVIDTSLKETTNIPKEKPRSVGVRCSAISCDHTKNANSCSFLTFPKNEGLKQRWVLAMQRCHVDETGKLYRHQLWEPKSQHRLCTCHFSSAESLSGKPEDYADLIPDTFDFSGEYTGRRNSTIKFRLKLNDAVISKAEGDNSMSPVELQNNESEEEEYTTGMGTISQKMANLCSALGCDHSKDKADCTLIKFPADIEWRKRWVIAMERCYVSDNGTPDRGRLWEPIRHSKLCTCHFSFPVEVKKKDPELRHIVPDIFKIPDENEEVCESKWSKCRLTITGFEEFEFSPKYLKLLEEQNKKEKSPELPRTFKQIIANIMDTYEKELIPKIPPDKNLNMCSALNCSHKIYDKACSFLSFPKDPLWRERWAIALRRCYVSKEGVPEPSKLWEPGEYHKLCACHFSVGINTRTRKKGYNHVIPDLLSFPNEAELSGEDKVWIHHRLQPTDEHLAKLQITPDDAVNPPVEDTSFGDKVASLVQDSFSIEAIPPDKEDSTADTADSNHLYGLLTKPKSDQINMLPYKDSMSGNMVANEVSLKLPLFVKYHTNGKEVSVEADSKEKQFHSHCAAVGCLHRVSQKLCSFLSFPKAPEWRQRWAFALRRCYVDEAAKPHLNRLWEPRDHHRLCTCHFSVPINAKTRKTGYNHVLPDVLSFPDEENDKSSSPDRENNKVNDKPSATKKQGQVTIKIEPDTCSDHDNSHNMNHTSGISQFNEDKQVEKDGTIPEDDWPVKTQASEDVQGDSVEESRGLQRDDLGYTVCSAPGCQHRRGENYCSFVSFPKYPELRQKWVASIQRFEVDASGERKLWEPGENHKLCVCHFSKPFNVRSRAPEVKLIVPDILDTSSFIAIPCAKKTAGNKQLFTLKRVDANQITKEIIAGWLPNEMEMFLVKNKRRKDFKSRNELLHHVWSYILQKRNKSTQTTDETEQSPASKRQKMSDSTSSGRQSTGQNLAGSTWFDNKQGPPGGALLSSIMNKVMTDYHKNSPEQIANNSSQEDVDIKPMQNVPLPVGYIDLNSQSSFQVEDSSKLQNHSSSLVASGSSETLQKLLRSAKVTRGGSSVTQVSSTSKSRNNKRLPTTETRNSSLLKSALTLQDRGLLAHNGTPSNDTFHSRLTMQSEKLDELEQELMDDTEPESRHREKLSELKAELKQLKHGQFSQGVVLEQDCDNMDVTEGSSLRRLQTDATCANVAELESVGAGIEENSDLSSMVIQRVKMYVCEFCDMEFKKKEPLFAHKTKWHSEQNVMEEWTRLEREGEGDRQMEKDQGKEEEEEVVMCRECGDEYDTEAELEEHMKSHGK